MHLPLPRRHKGSRPRYLLRLLVLFIVVETALVGTISAARAATAVAYLTADRQESYAAARVYAGRTVPGRASELGFKQSGEIEQVLVDIGDRVSAGDLLATLDTAGVRAQLAQAEADVALAAANLNAIEAEAELARQTESRVARLRESGHASAQQYDEQRLALRAKLAQRSVAKASLLRAEAARQAAEIALDEAHLYAPFSGTVQSRHKDEGAQNRAGESVLRLVETGSIEAHIGIPESLLAALSENPSHRIRWEGAAYPAELRAVLPEVDSATRTLTAVLQLQNTDIPLGAVVELEFSSRVPSPGYWLPLSALTESDRGLWGIYVINDASVIERRLVEVIHTEASKAYVRGTLNPGERVVSTGVQRLVPGQRVVPTAQG